jgi:hypothetical protein
MPDDYTWPQNAFSPAYKPPPPLHTRLATLILRLFVGYISAIIEGITESFRTPEVRGIHGSEHKRWQPLFEPPAPVLHPNYLAQQPIELIDRICHFLVEPADLLSLAMTSRSNCGIVVPRHLHFRRLHADVRWVNIWDALLANETVVPRFASLEIINAPMDSGAIVPLSLFPDGAARKSITTRSWEGPALQKLIQAAAGMEGLVRFHWTDASIRLTDQVDLLASLREHCPALEDIHIVNKRLVPRQDMFMDDQHHQVDPNELKKMKMNIAESPLWDLSDLVRFSYIAHGEGQGVDYARMYGMLIERCPRLEELSLYNHSRLQRIFSAGRWPRLTRLSFQGRSIRPSEQSIFSEFCDAHRNTLVCMQIDGPLAVNLTEMPSLRLLHIGFSSLARRVPSQTCHGLESLSLVIDAPSGGGPMPLEPMPNLKHLTIAGKTLPPACLDSIADAAPSVEWLGLSSSTWLFFKKTDFSDTNGPFSSFLAFLSRFSRLTHFSRLGIASECEPSTCCTFSNVMERIAWVVPTLQFISVANGETGKRRWLAVERYPVDKPGCYVNWAPVRNDLNNFPTETLSGFNPFESGTSGASPWSGTEMM